MVILRFLLQNVGFEIHEVTGPDEYTALVNNNYYTNKMAQQNLKYAAELAQQFGDKDEKSKLWAEAAQENVLCTCQ
uniref:Glyco_hydro_65m n=1 Tax=uncultured Actinosynnema sp. TaxID=905025 RepID=A0A060BZF4_9PSEU|nr:Glyco_hydro_65m [uncultured Actinosynnema sp.]